MEEHKDHIQAFLKKHLLLATNEDNKKRTLVLAKMQLLANEWACSGDKKSCCQVLPFGSFLLGVHNPSSDMDTLIVGPEHLTRENFFSTFKNKLLASGQVTKLVAVENAYVPVMKIVFAGVEMDLVYAQMPLASVLSLNVSADSILANLDAKSVLSLNGTRVTQKILSLVKNVDAFQEALRVIKFWATRRGIYSNSFGFLGGVAWAILVAYVCTRLCPKGNATMVLRCFFKLFSTWDWASPVLLCDVERHTMVSTITSWSSNDVAAMSVITPSYPAMNSTFNVNVATLRMIKEEMNRGAELLKTDKSFDWFLDQLCLKRCPFQDCKRFFNIVVSSQDTAVLEQYIGLVEANIRQFVIHSSFPGVKLTPWPKGFHSQDRKRVDFYIGIELDVELLPVDPLTQKKTANFQSAQHTFYSIIHSKAPSELKVAVLDVKRKNLPPDVYTRKRPREQKESQFPVVKRLNKA